MMKSPYTHIQSYYKCLCHHFWRLQVKPKKRRHRMCSSYVKNTYMNPFRLVSSTSCVNYVPTTYSSVVLLCYHRHYPLEQATHLICSALSMSFLHKLQLLVNLAYSQMSSPVILMLSVPLKFDFPLSPLSHSHYVFIRCFCECVS